jgi:hypothetical protein
MEFQDTKTNLFTLIKLISIVLISSAIGLELWNAYALITNSKIPTSLNLILLLAHLAISIHFFEGLIAAYKAPSKNKMPMKYGTYTFFVGTVGLLELFEK